MIYGYNIHMLEMWSHISFSGRYDEKLKLSLVILSILVATIGPGGPSL